MKTFDEQYIDLCRRILDHGESLKNYSESDSRAASVSSQIPNHVSQAKSEAKTLRLPHEIFRFDLEEGFPILTSKQVAFKTAVLELLWIYQVASNEVAWLKDRGVKIWNEWEIPASGLYEGKNYIDLYKKKGISGSPVGTIGTAYGWIVNRYSLSKNLLATLKSAPGNRRMVMSLWQNEWLETAALPSCVWNSQWNITSGRLNLLVTSRSSDVPLGLPFNIVQYATLCYLFAHCLGLKPGLFTFMTNDAHIYENQVDGIREQIRRFDDAMKSGGLPPAPTLWINPEKTDFFAFDNSKALSDVRLENYTNLGVLKMPVTE